MSKEDAKEYNRNSKSVIHRYFDSYSDSDDIYPYDIDEFSMLKTTMGSSHSRQAIT